MHEMPHAAVEQGPDTTAVDEALARARTLLEEKTRIHQSMDAWYGAMQDPAAADEAEQKARWDELNAQSRRVDEALAEMRNAIGDFYEAEAARDPKQELPEGSYRLEIRYPHLKGTADDPNRTRRDDARLWTANQRSELLKGARSKISMVGLHNFGLRSDRKLPTEVAFTLEHEQRHDIRVASKCWVDENGHIVGARKKK